MTATTSQILAALSAAASESGATLLLSASVYPQAAVRAAVDAFSNVCAFDMRDRKAAVELHVRVQPAHRHEAEKIIGELQNFLLRTAVEKPEPDDGS